MSLTIRLNLAGEKINTPLLIPVRRNGEIIMATVADWNEWFPDRKQDEGQTMETYETDEVYYGNVTHNLGTMADAVSDTFYKALWHPDEFGWTRAKELIDALNTGLTELQANPEKYKQYNPKNGWGNYEGLVEFVEGYLDACRQYPEAAIYVSR